MSRLLGMRCWIRRLIITLVLGHCAGDVRFYLYNADLPKEQRKEVASKLLAVLEILRNSLSKHLVDKDFERLKWRISWTLLELETFS
jgi:hypothetical protein